jgi:hypothetical protein
LILVKRKAVFQRMVFSKSIEIDTRPERIQRVDASPEDV